MYDIAIVGGGLAGLVNAIRLSKAGLKVALFEKKSYPFHKVCGEYISNEALPFLKSLACNPFDFGAVKLTQFKLTSPKGRAFSMPLDLGGFGISRYTLDNVLYQKASEKGCDFYLNTHVLSIEEAGEKKLIKTSRKGSFEANTVIGAYGKRSNLDNSLDRKFFKKKSPYLGVKYHIRYPKHAQDEIALHNFQNGYCGISRIEDEKYCLCYLTTRQNLKTYGNIEDMEANLLSQNKFLADIFTHAEFLYDKPEVINEISFAPKPLFEQNILMCGDSAGMITPLCGNGMAMAIHSAKILSALIVEYFQENISKESLVQNYQKAWEKHFKTRLWAGRNIQKMFGSPLLTEVLLQSAKTLPFIAGTLMKKTHGKVF